MKRHPCVLALFCLCAVWTHAAELKTRNVLLVTLDGLRWQGLALSRAVAAQARIAAAGFDVSDVKKGRKPGTLVFTVRNGTAGVPTILIQQNA
mgnify:CR=1 FL=1